MVARVESRRRVVVGDQRPVGAESSTAFAIWLVLSLVACQEDVAADGKPIWDTDGDSLSFVVELDSINKALYNFDTTVVDRNPSLARGTPGTGSIDSAIHLPNTGRGYYHFLGTDTIYTDDWGALGLVNTIEAAGRCWDQKRHRRTGIGDMSRRLGGSFTPHLDHENGLDADVRYVRRGGAAQDTLGLDLSSNPGDLDTLAQEVLWDCFILSPRVEFVIIDSATFRHIYPNQPKLRFAVDQHQNHFHVRILDPDGTGN